MDERTDQLIRELATKLGTTTEHLWGVLLRQAPISATMSLIAIIVMIVGSVGMVRWAFKSWSKEGRSYYDETPVLISIGAVLTVILTFVTFLIGGANVIVGYFNPEYWALSHVLRILR